MQISQPKTSNGISRGIRVYEYSYNECNSLLRGFLEYFEEVYPLSGFHFFFERGKRARKPFEI